MSTGLERLRAALCHGAATQLGIGPMSRHCVDATIELANSSRVPLMLIASRRQVECEAQGCGYANNWSTEAFAHYVRERDRGGYVLLCRDHGGPWQNIPEVTQRLPLKEAMASAKASFEVDIASGFDVVHIDPSIDIHVPGPSQEDVQERLFELYEFCMRSAIENQREIAIEIGSEEQSGSNQDVQLLKELLKNTKSFCEERQYSPPWFVVAQTGTLVKETRNVGAFDDPFRSDEAIPAEILVPRLIELCSSFGIYLKEHNADYLSNEALMWHPRLKIHASNIAPEFGVAQTRHILNLCDEFALPNLADRFIQLSYETGKWKKWMLPHTRASDRDRAIIAGHYTFGMPEFSILFDELKAECATRGLDLDVSIRDTIKLAIMRVMACFNLCSR